MGDDIEPIGQAGDAARMGPQLRAYVEDQLREDLRQYGLSGPGLAFDWSNPCPEGHVTDYLGGMLENWSDVRVIGADGQVVADGWTEFVHGGGDNPLFVFWEFLTIYDHGVPRRVKQAPGIPPHVWARLPEQSRDLCTKEGAYDAAWARDPLVIAWKRARQQRADSV